jgi:hypothetical protein
MVGLPGTHLLFHGAIVLMVGLLSGIPLRYAILQTKPEAIRAWRVTHSVLIMNGLMMLLIGMMFPSLILGVRAVWVLVWTLVISGYSFVIAFTIGAWRGVRGLTSKPYGLNTILYGVHLMGASGSLIGIAIIIYGSFKAF